MIVHHRTYRQIKQNFSSQRQAEIHAGAEKIKEELKILSTVELTGTVHILGDIIIPIMPGEDWECLK